MKKVITYGTFDLLHYGHIRLLERAKALGDYLIVGITSDQYDISRGKINNQQSLSERISALIDTGLADEIVVEEYEGQKIDDILKYEVDIFTVGSDWKGQFDYLNNYCKVVYLERTSGISSSDIRTSQRSLTLGLLGETGFVNKFKNEASYVNGLNVVSCDEKFNNVDAVYIASLPEFHYKQVKNALQNGKHVICESPIALNKNECIELYKIAEQNNLVLYDAIKTSFSTAYQRMISIAKSGRIGKILSVDSVCTSLNQLLEKPNLECVQNSICAWGPTALLPIFNILGSNYSYKTINTWMLDDNKLFDGFSKIEFGYPNAVASAKVAKAAKSEGELIITGTDGYIYVPSPWWKTDYFEIRFENPANNKRLFYKLDGEGIRNELVSFLRNIKNRSIDYTISKEISLAIADILDSFYKKNFTVIGDGNE